MLWRERSVTQSLSQSLAAPWRRFWLAASGDEKAGKRRPPVKPADIAYGVDDHPPAYILWVSALQHVFIATTVGLFMPLLVLDAAHASHATIQHVLSLCMLALGVGTNCAAWTCAISAPAISCRYRFPASTFRSASWRQTKAALRSSPA
jgi:hypothetical protein